MDLYQFSHGPKFPIPDGLQHLWKQSGHATISTMSAINLFANDNFQPSQCRNQPTNSTESKKSGGSMPVCQQLVIDLKSMEEDIGVILRDSMDKHLVPYIKNILNDEFSILVQEKMVQCVSQILQTELDHHIKHILINHLKLDEMPWRSASRYHVSRNYVKKVAETLMHKNNKNQFQRHGHHTQHIHEKDEVATWLNNVSYKTAVATAEEIAALQHMGTNNLSETNAENLSIDNLPDIHLSHKNRKVEFCISKFEGDNLISFDQLESDS